MFLFIYLFIFFFLKDNLCGQRGLEPGHELQTYIVNLPTSFREQFDIITKVFGENTHLLRLNTYDTTAENVAIIAKVCS